MDKEMLKNRTKQFAHRCLHLCKALPEGWIGWHLRDQLFRCATSVAANYRAACSSQSRRSFVSKLGVVLEEIDEASFWLEFIIEENLLTQKQCSSLLNEANELTAIFIASQKTARKKMENCKLKMEN